MDTPTIDDIADADVRIRPYAVKTPLLEAAVLNERLEARILCKAEPMQRTGSFKFRGAYNRVSRIDRAAYPGGSSLALRVTMRKASPRPPGYAALTP